MVTRKSGAQSTRLLHALTQVGNLPGYLSFLRASKDLKRTQLKKLECYLKRTQGTEVQRKFGLRPGMTVQEVRSLVPITSYLDWEDLINKQRKFKSSPILSSSCKYFEPTSGSLASRKWIPYTSGLNSEFNSAASSWLFDLFLRYPKMNAGKHYWSISWLTNDLREQKADTNDLRVFPFWKKWLFEKIMAVPTAVNRAPTLEASLLATSAHLAACRDLSMISVWSPTFLFGILRNLSRYRLELAAILSAGRWDVDFPGMVELSSALVDLKAPYAPEMANLLLSWDGKPTPEFLAKFWPSLALTSAWDSSTSKSWALEVQSLFSTAEFQGKGLWATEGVVTFPFRDQYPLAVTSHFYEFKDLENDEVFLPWELRVGQFVQPILTTGSGLWRYALQDRLEVTDFFNELPCFKFIGRLGGVDLVGEKLDRNWVESRLEQFSSKHSVQCLSMLAYSGGTAEESLPHYSLLVQGRSLQKEEMSRDLEASLLEAHHYRLARELGQLGHSRVRCEERALEVYERIRSSGTGAPVVGAQKLETITVVAS